MSDNWDNKKLDTSAGIIVEASLDLLRKAAKKILYEFSEVRYSIDGEEKSSEEELMIGDSVVFEEHITPGPAQVVITKLIRGLWYIISTSEMPQGGYGSGRDAMRAAEAEEKRERMIKEFLMKEAGVKKIEDVCDWKPELRTEAADVLNIINTTSRRYAH
ncbi:hypothetical protein E4H12_09665 [Candidatus Thorarchaeota archaeon]|nr:MAG: hypothetical protein E4H12_09665 [Candidatus Thorarchaeota archaeon]